MRAPSADDAALAAVASAAAALASHPPACDGTAAFVERTAAALGVALHERTLGAAAFLCVGARNAAEARRVLALAEALPRPQGGAIPRWQRLLPQALLELELGGRGGGDGRRQRRRPEAAEQGR